MGGGAISTPATTASTISNHHSWPPPRSSTISPFSSNFCPQSSDFVDENETRSSGYRYQTNFGPVPSLTEVQNAISDLQKAMNEVYASNLELKGVGQIMEQCPYDSSRTLIKSWGEKKLLDAYHLLQTDASIQRLVLSICLDTGVWDAILKNDAVQDLHESTTEAKDIDIRDNQEPDLTSLVVKWIFEFMKSKIMDCIEKLRVLIVERLRSMSENEKSTSKLDDVLEEKIRSSVLLSVVILVIVVVTRSIET